MLLFKKKRKINQLWSVFGFMRITTGKWCHVFSNTGLTKDRIILLFATTCLCGGFQVQSCIYIWPSLFSFASWLKLQEPVWCAKRAPFLHALQVPLEAATLSSPQWDTSLTGYVTMDCTFADLGSWVICLAVLFQGLIIYCKWLLTLKM